MSVLREENAVAPLAIGDRQNLRSGREPIGFSGEKRVGPRSEKVIVRCVASFQKAAWSGSAIGRLPRTHGAEIDVQLVEAAAR
jgi:hypothetical protein